MQERFVKEVLEHPGRATVSGRLMKRSSLPRSVAVRVFILRGHKNVTLGMCRPVREEAYLCMLIGLSQPPAWLSQVMDANSQLAGYAELRQQHR